MATAGQVIKCKAAVAWEPNKPLVIEEIEVAPPKANEVRIKIVATGMCHTDLYHLFESMSKDGYPVILGHEGAGIVESVGPGVTEFQPGDKVIPLPVAQCRECRFCKSPKTNHCEKALVVNSAGVLVVEDSRFTCKGKKVLQFLGTSTFSEYTVMNQIAVAKIDPAAPLDKVIKCKAAVAWEPNKPLVIEEIEVAPPQANEVRIKIVATGVCHSDLYHLFESMNNTYPIVLGHEGAGIIESVGPGVTEFQPGDKVIPLPIPQCRECRFCKSPKTNQCEKAWVADSGDVMALEDSRFTCKGKKVLQFMGTSTFSEYTVMKQIAVAKIDPAAPLDKVCLLGCGICTGYGAAVNTAKVEPGSTCAVFGLGAVGLAAVMGCYVAGAKRIIAVDINPEKFEKAKVFGATDFINPKDHDKPIHEVLIEMTNGGVDFSLECVGNVGVMRSALESCIKGWGVSVIVGFTNMDDFAARPIQLIAGRTWKGSLVGGFKGKDGVPELVKAYLNKKIKVDEFITHNMTLAQVNDAIELMKHSKCIRTVLSVSPQ